MKFLKALLIIVLILVVAYVIACFFGPKRFDVTTTEEIDARPAVVYNNVADLRQWEKWSSWHQMEGVELSYGEKTKDEGASYSWKMDGKEGGNMRIIGASRPDSLQTQLQFAGWDGYSYGKWVFEPQGDGTKVTWNMEGDSDLPFYMRGVSLFMEGAVNSDFKKGLEALKKLSESSGDSLVYNGYEIKEIEYPAKTYLAVRNEIPMDSMKVFYENSYGAIMAHINAKQYEMAGPPVGIYYIWDMENGVTDIAAAIPVSANSIEGTETVKVIETPTGNVAMINYFGDYAKLMEPHEAMEQYLQENGLEMDWPILEEYVTDPMNEPDTTKWQTKIVYFVK